MPGPPPRAAASRRDPEPRAILSFAQLRPQQPFEARPPCPADDSLTIVMTAGRNCCWNGFLVHLVSRRFAMVRRHLAGFAAIGLSTVATITHAQVACTAPGVPTGCVAPVVYCTAPGVPVGCVTRAAGGAAAATPGVGTPGRGVVDPGINQPGAAGNVGGGAPGVGTVDPGVNQPGAAGNRGAGGRR